MKVVMLGEEDEIKSDMFLSRNYGGIFMYIAKVEELQLDQLGMSMRCCTKDLRSMDMGNRDKRILQKLGHEIVGYDD